MSKVETGMKIAAGVGLSALAVGTLVDDPTVEDKAFKIFFLSLMGMSALMVFGLDFSEQEYQHQ